MTKIDKTMTVGKIRETALQLYGAWEQHKGQVKLSGMNMYRLLDLKKTIETRADVAQATVRQVALGNGGEEQPDGNIKLPEDRLMEINKILQEVFDQEDTISYSPIVIGESDSIPIELMDILFDFIEIKED